ncbi:MAG: TrkA family potassium uptake protein [Lentisphaerae bacterium]|nr:TrkA family potassium uptake protein [Lentisphaerota bacterium]
MKKKIGIVGGGRFGMTLAQSLAAKGVDVILVDSDWHVVQSLADTTIRAVHGDGSLPDTLREAGFADCDMAVVAISSSLECSTLATINCKDLGVRRVIAKASSDLQGRVLSKIGADIVVFPDRDRAFRLAKHIIANAPIDLFEIAEGYSVGEISVPKSLVGKTLIEGNVRQVYGVTVLAIRRTSGDGKGPRETIITQGVERLQDGDILVVFGPDENLEKLSR